MEKKRAKVAGVFCCKCCNDPEVDDLCSGIGLQALPQVFHYSYSPARRILWLLLLILGMVASLFFASQLISDYSSFDSSTLVSLDNPGPEGLVFPAVTIWNLNPFRASYLKGSLYEELCSPKADPNEAIVFSTEGLPPGFNDSFVKEAAHPLEDILVGCTYLGNPCRAEDFEAVVTPYPHENWGVGYTFNPTSIKQTRQPGPRGGLHLQLDIHEEDYCPRTWGRGIRILFHDHKGLTQEQASVHIHPNLGSTIGVGKRWTFGLEMTEYSLLGEPYGVSCIDLDGGANYPDPRAGWICVEENCDGVDASTVTTFNIRAFGNKCVEDCFAPKTFRFCEGVSYKYELGQEPLAGFDVDGVPPADEVKKSPLGRFLNRTKGKGLDGKDISAINEGISRNILVADIYYKELVKETLKEIPNDSIWQLFAEIGGLLGLFLGASIATAFEMTEVACILCCRYSSQRSSSSPDSSQANNEGKRASLYDKYAVCRRQPYEV